VNRGLVNISFRVTDEIDDDVVGFFKMSFDNFEYGYYHDSPLNPDEVGHYLINIWMKLLAEGFLNLELNGYFAIRDIETENIWIEFIQQDEQLNVRIFNKEGLNDHLLLMPIETLTIESCGEANVLKIELKKEIVRNMESLLEIVRESNSDLLESRKYSSLSKLLMTLKKE
jgi:hypothetical protein